MFQIITIIQTVLLYFPINIDPFASIWNDSRNCHAAIQRATAPHWAKTPYWVTGNLAALYTAAPVYSMFTRDLFKYYITLFKEVNDGLSRPEAATVCCDMDIFVSLLYEKIMYVQKLMMATYRCLMLQLHLKVTKARQKNLFIKCHATQC